VDEVQRFLAVFLSSLLVEAMIVGNFTSQEVDMLALLVQRP